MSEPDPSPRPAPEPDPSEHDQPGSGEQPATEPESGRRLLPVRRAPRIGRFIVTGALAGLVLGVLATVVASPRTESFRILVLFSVLLGIVGGLLGGTLALLADRRAARREP